MTPRLWIAVAAGYGFLGVVLGAFGAHALRARLGEEMLAVYRTGVEYHFVHALALLAVALLARASPSPQLNASAWCFALGVLVFSGSLYALALSGVKVLGAVTPIGGLLFLAGWALLLVWAMRSA
jgi:uncharacterized membrane protein YgdD (TMEM256/DUF423 family)